MIGRVFHRPEYNDYFIVMFEDHDGFIYQVWSDSNYCASYGWRVSDFTSGELMEML